MNENSSEDNLKKSSPEQGNFNAQKYLKILDDMLIQLNYIKGDAEFVLNQTMLGDDNQVHHIPSPENITNTLKYIKRISHGPFITDFFNDLKRILIVEELDPKIVNKVMYAGTELRIAQSIVWSLGESEELPEITDKMSLPQGATYSDSEVLAITSFYSLTSILYEKVKIISEIIRKDFSK